MRPKIVFMPEGHLVNCLNTVNNDAWEVTSRAPTDDTADDTILPFEVAALDLRGRVVRLGPALDDILSRHGYRRFQASQRGNRFDRITPVLLNSMAASSCRPRPTARYVCCG
jgi:hypothetical protein